MQTGFVSIVAMALLLGCQPVPGAQAPPGTVTVIEGARIIDGISGTPLEDGVIVIEKDTIRAVGKRGTIQVPTGVSTVNVSGKFIMPGIFNLHGHVGRVEGLESKDENYNRERLLRDANIYLYYGVMQVISLGNDMEPMFPFRAEQRSGQTGGARFYTAGQGFRAVNDALADRPYANRPATQGEARQFVQKEVAKDIDFVKIWLDDQAGPAQKLIPDLYGAIIDEAHKHNKKVLVHMISLDQSKELIRRGVDALAHSVLDKEVDDEFLRLAKEKGITQIATLVGHQGNLAFADKPGFVDDPGLPLLFPAVVLDTLRVRRKEYSDRSAKDPNIGQTRRQFETASKNAKKIADAGIPIAIGTDSGIPARFPGLWEHREMELLVRAGLTPMQAIQAATINSAKFMGIDAKYGSMTSGKVADFIILSANPLEEITNSRRIDAVWMNGKQVNRP